MKVLVTGGNGFIGSHLVDRLLEQGFDVRCVLRRKSNRRWLDGKPIDLVCCDEIEEGDVIAKAVHDVEILFHVLGTLVAPDIDRYRQINVEPVRWFLEACAGQKQCPRFVLVGSQGAAGPNPGGIERLSETDPCRPVSAYGRTKLEAEDLLKRETRVPWTIVRPSAMYGPRDVNFLKIFQSACRKGRIPQVGREPKTIGLAHARDVVEGICQAATSDNAVGQTYFLASELPYSTDDLCQALEAAVGKKVQPRIIPDSIVKAMMLYADVLSHVFRKDVLLNRDRLTTLSHPRWFCDVSKARRELGYRQRISLNDGFQETYQWYLREGWL
jgi:dihydroflavonol-4-reductase